MFCFVWFVLLEVQSPFNLHRIWVESLFTTIEIWMYKCIGFIISVFFPFSWIVLLVHLALFSFSTLISGTSVSISLYKLYSLIELNWQKLLIVTNYMLPNGGESAASFPARMLTTKRTLLIPLCWKNNGRNDYLV